MPPDKRISASGIRDADSPPGSQLAMPSEKPPMNFLPVFLADMNQAQAQAKATSWKGSPCFLGLIWMVTFCSRAANSPSSLSVEKRLK